LDEAEDMLLNILKQDGDNSDVLFNLGYLYKLKDNLEKSLEYLKHAYENAGNWEAMGEIAQVINEAETELTRKEMKQLSANDMNVNALINKGEEYLKEDNDEAAYKYYKLLIADNVYKSFAYFRLGEIYNRMNKPLEAYRCHRNAFLYNPKFVQLITSNDSIHYNYVFSEVKEVQITDCPICGSKGAPKYSFNTVSSLDFIPGFSPVRLWMHCSECNHIFAGNYPVDLFKALTEYTPPYYLNINTKLLHIISDKVQNIKRFSKGRKLLEVGLGSGEMTALAKEYQFDVTGIELREDYAKNIQKMLGITAHVIDFLKYDTAEKYDVICLGDVLEHLTDPVGAIKKAQSLLTEDGILWISTPNFESAYSYIRKDKDPMWRVCEHLNYFSFESLKKLLAKYSMEVVDYKASAHYNGSMEVIAKKI
jgi:SAM-dependent methyltransferase